MIKTLLTIIICLLPVAAHAINQNTYSVLSNSLVTTSMIQDGETAPFRTIHNILRDEINDHMPGHKIYPDIDISPKKDGTNEVVLGITDGGTGGAILVNYSRVDHPETRGFRDANSDKQTCEWGEGSDTMFKYNCPASEYVLITTIHNDVGGVFMGWVDWDYDFVLKMFLDDIKERKAAGVKPILVVMPHNRTAQHISYIDALYASLKFEAPRTGFAVIDLVSYFEANYADHCQGDVPASYALWTSSTNLVIGSMSGEPEADDFLHYSFYGHETVAAKILDFLPAASEEADSYATECSYELENVELGDGVEF